MTTTIYARKLAPRGHVDVMEHAGHKARLMRANRLVGDGVFGLPPGEAVPVFPIAALPAAPAGWNRDAGTYVCPVSPSWGLWFDWTMNDTLNTAIVPSVKGMNPITGQKIEAINIAQYKDKCPIHGCDFSHGRLCEHEECGYKWPPQNYVAYPNTLWWDGFRQADGTVAQFFFSEDDARDVASAIIGKENTVPAFGFAFFRTKTQRIPDIPKPRRKIGVSGFSKKCGISSSKSSNSTGKVWKNIGGKMGACAAGGANDGSASFKTFGREEVDDIELEDLGQDVTHPMFFSPLHTPQNWDKGSMMRSAHDHEGVANINVIKDVSVGGGARIDQKLEPDTLEPEDWKDKPSAIIRLYFVFEPQFKQFLREGGIKDLSGDSKGYLKDIPIG